MKTIDEIKPKVAELAKEATETKSICWLGHTKFGEWTDAYYCSDCAAKMQSWLTGQDQKPIDLSDGEDHPFSWLGSNPGEVWYGDTRGDWETEGPESCELCGCRLESFLLVYGVQSEIEHFEGHGIKTPDDWRDFYAVLTGIAFVEDDWFPYEWRDEALCRDLYHRALVLAERYLPK